MDDVKKGSTVMHRHLFTLLLGVSCLFRFTSAQLESFGPEQVIENQATGAADVEIVDLDGDGLLDILAASVNDDTVGWFKNLGGGVFSPRMVITQIALGARAVAAGDLDGDGDIDVVVGSHFDRVLAWHENLGNGVFGTRQVIASQVAPNQTVSVFDLDGDGDLDLLTSSNSQGFTGSASWWPNPGDGGFGTELVIMQWVLANDAWADDLDGDGDLDLLIATQDVGVNWVENQGGGSFGTPQFLSAGGGSTTRIRGMDLDDDGDMDIVASSVTSLFGFLNLGGGVFGPETFLANSGSHTDMALADLDEDGDLDIVTASVESGSIAWFENMGGATLSGPIPIDYGGFGVSALAVGDLDEDGGLDLVNTSFTMDEIAWRKGFLKLEAHPLLAMKLRRPNERLGASLLAVDDLDGDGFADLVTGSREVDLGKGRLRAWSSATGQEIWIVDGTTPGDQLGQTLAVAGDVDGDGVSDIVAGMPESGSSRGRVDLRSGATGALLATDVGAVTGDHFGMALAGRGDWDGDGVFDFLVGAPLHDLFGLNSGYVRVYSGQTGTVLATLFGFAPHGEFGRALAFIPDRTGDGLDEVLVVLKNSSGVGVVSILEGGSGAPLTTLSPGQAGPDFGVALAVDRDVNGDGVAEILVGDPSANGGDGSVWLFDGATLGVIRVHSGAASSALGTTVAFTGDLNGDGQEDYLLAEPGHVDGQGLVVGRVQLVDGGGGTFLNGALVTQGVPATTFEGGAYTAFGQSIAGLGDVDGDGYAEIAVGLPLRSQVWIYGGLNPVGLYDPCAQGSVDEPLLFLDGTFGGAPRRVTVPVNTSFTLTMGQPPGAFSPASFAIAGYLGVPTPNQATVLPFGFGVLCLPAPDVDPAAFLLTNNFTPFVPQLIPSSPAPWTLSGIAGIPVPFEITFQGVIVVGPADLRTTNAVILSVVP